MQFCVLMKKIMIVLLGLSLFAVTGCDFFRQLAGRPTSADIEARRLEILLAEQEAAQARLDSLIRQQQIAQDHRPRWC